MGKSQNIQFPGKYWYKLLIISMPAARKDLHNLDSIIKNGLNVESYLSPTEEMAKKWSGTAKGLKGDTILRIKNAGNLNIIVHDFSIGLI